jgi:hypothetical protein
MKKQTLAFLTLLAAPSSSLQAACCEHQAADQQFQAAKAIAEYRILSAETYKSAEGNLRTRFTASLTQGLKGDAPAHLEFSAPGGTLGGVAEHSSLALDLSPGDDCIFHLSLHADGTWTPRPFQTHRQRGSAVERKALRDFFRGGARGRMPATTRAVGVTGSDQSPSGIPGSVVTPTGYSEAGGIPTRFTACDGGHPIPYLVDIDPAKLPPGMTQQTALEAVAEALAAWSDVSSLKFRFEGTQSFGMAASQITTNDGKLRIQLHDTFNANTEPNVLGIGGGGFTADTTVLRGGSIGGQGFHERLRAYVVLEHEPSFMDDIANFKQVLTHEIGHAMGLAHSSNNPNEPEPILKNATMYYSASNDGRGAAITAYDEDRIAYGYSPVNSPPYTTDRIIRAVARTSSSAPLPVTLGVNRIELRGTDLQGTALTAVRHASSSAKLTLDGNQLVYAPTDFSTGPRLTDDQIQAGTSYSLGYIQFSDGVNLSRPARCTVVEIAGDSTPADGLPNGWMNTYFGTTTPGAPGSPSHPDSDPDGDGLTNREEYALFTDPTSAASGPTPLTYHHPLRTLTLDPIRFAPYAIESASSLAGPWTVRSVGTDFTGSGLISVDFSEDPPANRAFYRARTGP